MSSRSISEQWKGCRPLSSEDSSWGHWAFGGVGPGERLGWISPLLSPVSITVRKRFLLMSLDLFWPLVLIAGSHLHRQQWGHISQLQGGGAKWMVMICNKNKHLTCASSPSGGQKQDQNPRELFPSYFRGMMSRLQHNVFLPSWIYDDVTFCSTGC